MNQAIDAANEKKSLAAAEPNCPEPPRFRRPPSRHPTFGGAPQHVVFTDRKQTQRTVRLMTGPEGAAVLVREASTRARCRPRSARVCCASPSGRRGGSKSGSVLTMPCCQHNRARDVRRTDRWCCVPFIPVRRAVVTRSRAHAPGRPSARVAGPCDQTLDDAD